MTISRSYFEFYETDHEANPTEQKVKVYLGDLRAKVLLRCARFDGKKLAHLIDIAMEGGPVDLTHFERGALVWSARLQLIRSLPAS